MSEEERDSEYMLTRAFRGDGEARAISLSRWGPLLPTFRTVTSTGHLLPKNPSGNTVPLGPPASLSAHALAPWEEVGSSGPGHPHCPSLMGHDPYCTPLLQPWNPLSQPGRCPRA